MAEVKIENLGSEGDGIGRIDGKPIYVTGALPGETVRISGPGPHFATSEILTPSKERQSPPCPHFSTCGGCTFQHASLPMLLQWKRAEVALAFKKAGIDVAVDETFASAPSSRRRVTFSARRDGKGVLLGFKERGSDNLVTLQTCAILLPELAAQISPLRAIASTMLRGNEEIQISINACDNGMDLDFTLPQQPSETMTASFVRAMAKSPYLRGCVNGESVIEKEKPLVTFGRAHVALPPANFIQAVAAVETEMARLVCDHLRPSKRVADLFCGGGTFALRLAERSSVHAVEWKDDMLKALQAASGPAKLKEITVERRNLHDLPLTVADLKPFDGLCLDPPRAGAEDQVIQIAKTNLRRIAYVSCNPGTLARDSRHLIDGGFRLKRVVPLDQFVYSPHIEVVALFEKKPSKGARSIFR